MRNFLLSAKYPKEENKFLKPIWKHCPSTTRAIVVPATIFQNIGVGEMRKGVHFSGLTFLSRSDTNVLNKSMMFLKFEKWITIRIL
jgi:hypothetical protein